MATDLTAMILGVRTRLGTPSTDGFFTDAQITDMINESLQYNNTLADWPWCKATTTFATVSGTATYDPTAASGWMKTRALTIDGYDSMALMSLIEIRERQLSITGTPSVYCVENELIHLRDVPNAVFTVIHDYIKVEPVLSGGSSVPLMPDQFRYSIIEFATYLAAMRQGDWAGADRALARHAKWYDAMSDHRRRTTSTRRVRVRPGSGL